MRWGPVHVNAMLALRNLASNDRWDQGWQAIRKQWQQEVQAQRTQRATQSSPQTAGKSSSPPVLPVTPPADMATPTQQAPPVVERTGSQPTRLATTHPRRRPFLQRRLA